MPEKLHVIVCENLADEVRAAAAAERFSDVEIVPFAAKCGQAESGAKRLEARIESLRGRGARVFILGGTCLTGKTDKTGSDSVRTTFGMDQCFPLFVGQPAVEGMIRAGAYLVTSGWVRHWRRSLEEWGFSQAQAREFFAETTKRIVLLDSGVNPKAEKEARAFAEFIGLPITIQAVGLDLLRIHLRVAVLEWRLENERRKTADLAMLSELSEILNRVGTEPETIADIVLLFRSLFAPKRILYLPLVFDLPGKPVVAPDHEAVDPADIARLRAITGDYAVLESGDGFGLRVSHRGETLGYIEVRGFAFPAHRDHYLNLALTVSRIAGMAVSNARAYQLLREEQDRTQSYLALAEKAAREKEVLLKELNHRIKNNFQMLAGMIRLQSAQLKDPHVLAICRDVQSRIKSLAHVHERLYLSSNLAAVDFAAYIDRMIGELAKSYQAEASRIRVIAAVEEIGFNVGTSIPLGLIINELIINAFKHAFPDGREGTIHISLRTLPDGRFELDVRDDGVGLPAGFAVDKAESLGLQLIGMLAGQIDGTVEIVSDAGAHFRIFFKERMS